MSGVRTIVCCAVGLIVAAEPARAQVPLAPPPPTIAEGVSAGRVELGGLTVAEATTRLRTALRPRLRRHLVLLVGRRRFGLRMRRVRLELDADQTARRALKAPPDTEVRLSLSHSRRAVRRFVRRVARRVDRRARNARLRMTVRRMYLRGGRSGRRLARGRTVKRISFVLRLSSLRRRVRARVRPVRPRVRKRELRRAYPSVITIQRSTFRLRFFRRLRYDRSYSVAVGQPGHPTPTGRFRIQSKQVNPVWTAPNSPWAGELRGQSFAGGSANNPLKARWMGVTGSVGIHGTGEDWSIGTAASHGCIRMHVWDVVELFNRTRLGSPVLIR